jgi:hypothetical protein
MTTAGRLPHRGSYAQTGMNAAKIDEGLKKARAFFE